MRVHRRIEDLRDRIPAQDNNQLLKQVAEKYAVAVTDSALRAIKTADDPVGRQYLPDTAELVTRPEELRDPIGDEAHSPVPGVVHRYPDRVLLMPVKACAVYCRFCFRREHVGPGQQALKSEELARALDYIRGDENIWEVILSGGDPLILSPRRLGALLDEIENIGHVKVIRFHTRVPVAAPERVTQELTAALERRKAVYVAIHVNHAQEITPEAEEAFARLRAAGCVLLSQSVLLRGVNDDPEALETLFRRLVALRVKPYYLHHPDLAPGTGHFRLGLREGQAIVRRLLGRVSGLCRPAYMLDIPGGHGKIPAGPDYIREDEQGLVLEDPAGGKHPYPR